jgi:MoxR-like ATPase
MGQAASVGLNEITREAVDAAMSLALEMGRKPFLETNGFGYATTYLLLHEGRLFDPKAIIGVAHGRLPGREPLQPGEFDATEAIQRLRRLEYTVVSFSGLWWVNQGATYDEERAGGYVWAPQTNKLGHEVPHHIAVNQLRVGQKIVHYAAGQVRAIGTVAQPPETHPKPKELGTAWAEAGYICRVQYHDLVPPIAKADVPNRTSAVGPFDVNGNLKQAYLVKVNDAELFPLLEFLYARDSDLFDPADPASLPDLPTLATLPEESVAHPLVQLLLSAKNIVLEGVPGTGKTYAVETIADSWQGVTGRKLLRVGTQPFAATVMHPSTSYEDFIEGLRPTLGEVTNAPQPRYFDEPASGGGKFRLDDGFFLRACSLAAQNPNADLLVLLDELNRCNVPSVLGDLLLSIESSKRARFMGSDPSRATASDWEVSVSITLPYSRRRFFVPDNLYVIATTNTTDRSVAPLDAAIRRRFSFVRMEPDFEPLRDQAQQLTSDARRLFDDSLALMENLNDTVLRTCIGPDAMLGQSYLYGMHARLQTDAPDKRLAIVREVWEYQILPQLIESVRAHGAEDLLDAASRGHWLSDHNLESTMVTASSSLDTLDDFLRGLGLALVVDGTGLARGARVVTAWARAAATADLLYPEVAVDVADLEAEDTRAEITS